MTGNPKRPGCRPSDPPHRTNWKRLDPDPLQAMDQAGCFPTPSTSVRSGPRLWSPCTSSESAFPDSKHSQPERVPFKLCLCNQAQWQVWTQEHVQWILIDERVLYEVLAPLMNSWKLTLCSSPSYSPDYTCRL